MENENKQKKGVTDEGVLFNTILLITRKVLLHKRFLMIKVFELYIKFLIIIVQDQMLFGCLILKWLVFTILLDDKKDWFP